MKGIYEIRNTITGDFYIGKSEKILSRWQDHLALLIAGKHHSARLQKDWNIHGVEAFSFRIIEEIADAQERTSREADLIQQLRPTYNVALTPAFEKALAAARPPRQLEKSKYKAVCGGVVLVEEEELNIIRCPNCNKPMLLALQGSEIVLIPLTEGDVGAQFLDHLSSDAFEKKLMALPDGGPNEAVTYRIVFNCKQYGTPSD